MHQDPLIPLPSFLVIAAVRHIRSLSQIQAAEFEEFFKLVKTTHLAIKEAIDVAYLTLVQEESSEHLLVVFPLVSQPD